LATWECRGKERPAAKTETGSLHTRPPDRSGGSGSEAKKESKTEGRKSLPMGWLREKLQSSERGRAIGGRAI